MWQAELGKDFAGQSVPAYVIYRVYFQFICFQPFQTDVAPTTMEDVKEM